MGTISARDLLGEVHAEDSISKFMQPDVPLLDEQTDIKTALSYMLEKGVTALPLVKDGKVTGIITATDLLKLLERLIEGSVRVRDIVNRGEAVVSHPLVQNLMKALGDAGI